MNESKNGKVDFSLVLPLSMTKKRVLIFSLVLIGLFLIYKFAAMMAPGSYPFAENYELDYPEDEVIEAIKTLKDSDPDWIVPNVTIQGSGSHYLNDGKRGETDFWHHFYFYNKKKNQILATWTRPSGANTTTFAFVSINNGLDLGHWKVVNDDFGFFENRKIKKDFEATILKRIKEKLEE